MTDPYYSTKAWLDVRHMVLRRDHNRCVVPGCGRRATIVDHILSRREGGSDTPNNLRSLCRQHDNEIKEASGKRRNVGFRGSTRDGLPIDPQHHWNKEA